ncbi:MAG: hypothetical protein CM15mP6_4190 [Methanobacteriota archaeon]|nr:MAG: hypothetical protein CM15mP6_4190 [Euryarchaeota archaeon]
MDSAATLRYTGGYTSTTTSMQVLLGANWQIKMDEE